MNKLIVAPLICMIFCTGCWLFKDPEFQKNLVEIQKKAISDALDIGEEAVEDVIEDAVESTKKPLKK